MKIHVLSSLSSAAPNGHWLDYVAECEGCGWLSDRHERAASIEHACPQCESRRVQAQRRAALVLLGVIGYDNGCHICHEPMSDAAIVEFEQWAGSTNYCGFNREA